MQSQDRRIRRTQQLLARALIALTLEKGYETVTIREITERADVGYTTFFRHYKDKDELLQDVLEVVLADLISLLGSQPALNDPVTTGTILFRYVQEHSEVVRVLLDSLALRRRLIELATQSTIVGKEGVVQNAVSLVEVVSNHIVTSSISLVEWWLARQMPYSIEQMGQIYATLIVQPTGEVIPSLK